MTISMHAASVPLFRQQFKALLGWLDKAEAYAAARKFDADNYLQLRLAPDMLPFASQIRIASDGAKACVARLAGVDAPKFEDNETTLAALRERVHKTLAYLESVPADAVDGSEGRDIVIPMRPPREAVQMQGLFYLQHWALPNFYFHITMAYALLRQAGVELGKGDYLALG